MLVSYASHHIQHMQKALEQMNLKLSHVVSDITGLTGRGIIKAILAVSAIGQTGQTRDHAAKVEATVARSKGIREEHLLHSRVECGVYSSK